MESKPMTDKEKTFRLWAANALRAHRQAERDKDTFLKGIEWGKYCAYRGCAMSLGLDRGDYDKYC